MKQKALPFSMLIIMLLYGAFLPASQSMPGGTTEDSLSVAQILQEIGQMPELTEPDENINSAGIKSVSYSTGDGSGVKEETLETFLAETTNAEEIDINKEILKMAKARNLKGVMNLLPKMTELKADDGGTEGTLAHFAAYNNWLPLLKILIHDKRLPADIKNQWDNRSPFLSACCGGSMDIVKYYIEELQYPKWKEGNENGMTCAHFAAREDHHRLLAYMIHLWKQGENATSSGPVLSPDVEDWMPIHYAANNGHKEATIVLMLEARSDPYKKNKEGKAALSIAKDRGDAELTEIMVDPMKYKILAIVEGVVAALKSKQSEEVPKSGSAVSTRAPSVKREAESSLNVVREEIGKLRNEIDLRFEEVRMTLRNQAHGLKALQEGASQKLQELAQFVKMKTKLVATAMEVKHKAMESDFLAFRDVVESQVQGLQGRMDAVGNRLEYSTGELKRETEKESHNFEVVKREFPRLWGHLDQLRKDLKKLEEKFPSRVSSRDD